MQNRKYFIDNILNLRQDGFGAMALELFEWQRIHTPVLGDFLKSRRVPSPSSLLEISPLPISFFKTHDVFNPLLNAGTVFLSSGTTGMIQSRHLVHDLSWYEKVFEKNFRYFFGDPRDHTFLFLLPSYMERQGSSLIYMAERMVKLSGDKRSGFYLNANEQLKYLLEDLGNENRKTLLFGVTFALLDMAASHPLHLGPSIEILDTGGMKGRREEWIKEQVHEKLISAFRKKRVMGEYGMTELMSQAYSFGSGIYQCPPWMRVFIRSEDDPGELKATGRGQLVIFDLANIDSCAFIETQDVGKVFDDGRFEVLGRLDGSDLRGCSMLTA